MKVCVFTDLQFPNDRANAIQRLHMSEAFAVENDVMLIVKNEPSVAFLSSIGVNSDFTIIASCKSNIWMHRCHSLKKLLQYRPDMIFTRDIYFSFLVKLFGFNSVLELHTGRFNLMQKFLIKFIFFRPYIVLISEGLRARFSSLYPEVSANNIIVLHDGVLRSRIVEKVEHLLLPYSVAYVGSFYKGRGIDLVLDLARRNPEVEFHLYGNGVLDEIPTNVRFHGSIPNNKVVDVMRGHSILLMPYQQDTSTSGGDLTIDWMSPLKMFEYMASGSLIISSDFPVIREVLSENNALLVEADDYDKWDKALKYALNNYNLLYAKRVEAVKRVYEYTYENRVHKILKFAKN